MRVYAWLAALAALSLAGCATTKPPVVVYRSVVVETPESLMRCPGVRLPDPDTLTDKGVSRALRDLSGANATCRASIQAIKDFQSRSKAELETKGQ